MSELDHYLAQIREITFECSINRQTLRSSINAFKGDEQIFNWPETTLKSFEQIHGLSRVLMLCPDKLATALAINEENIENETGIFLTQLVVKLLIFYSSQKFQRENQEVSDSILDTIEQISIFESKLEERNREEGKLAAATLFRQIDPYLCACQIYVKFLHSEVIKIQRDPARAIQTEDFSRTIEIIRDTPSLQSEFNTLISEEEE